MPRKFRLGFALVSVSVLMVSFLLFWSLSQSLVVVPDSIGDEGEEMTEGRPEDSAPSLNDLPQSVVLRSGIPAEYALPWEAEEEFAKTVDESGTPIRMAAVRLILDEPLDTELANIALAASRLAGTLVPPGATFLQNECLGPYDEAHGFLPGNNYVGGRVVVGVGGGVCKIATGLYNLTVLSDLPIVARRGHSMIVPYVPPGQDATVTYTGGQDYRFKNDTNGPLLIWSQLIDNVLYMAFYGVRPSPHVEWQHEIISHMKATTEVRVNKELQPGQSRVIFPGFDAYTVQSWAVVTAEDGTKRRRDLGVSRYRMAPRIVERGP